MNPSSVDIKSLLIVSGGFTFGTDLFIGEMPDIPNSCICLFDTSGGGIHPKRTERRPRLMVHVRGKKGDYTGSYADAETIIDFLHGFNNTAINGTNYAHILAVGDTHWLGYDEKQRPKWSINFEILRTT